MLQFQSQTHNSLSMFDKFKKGKTHTPATTFSHFKEDPYLERNGELHRAFPFSESLRGLLDVDNSCYLEISPKHPLYSILVRYVIDTQMNKNSFNSFGVLSHNKPDFFDPQQTIKNIRKDRNTLTLGIGFHEFDHKGHRIRILHQIVGEPVSGPQELRTIVLFVDKHSGGTELLKDFCDTLIEWDERTIDKVYRIYQWNPKRSHWQNIATKLIRPVDSVILPEILKEKILKDIDSFNAPESAKWYGQHGICYKRTYLFYGPPGAGKTSFIRVLAGHLGRNLCFLQPANPNLDDDSIQLCLQTAPENAIVVIEDIDALFDADRNKKAKECPLTFSGLLNALDGIANRDGQIFVLTTNYIDRLDKALIRPGRVDMRVEFHQANAEQVRGLFLHFYPNEFEAADKFAAEIVKRYGAPEGGKEGELNGKLSMAALQQHFIYCRTSSAEEAVAKLDEFMFYESS